MSLIKILQKFFIEKERSFAKKVFQLVCDRLNASMLLLRKEAKKYGMKKLIEGEYKAGGKVLVIEDVVTSGLYHLIACLVISHLSCSDFCTYGVEMSYDYD